MSSSVAEEETKETEDVAIPKKKRAPRKKKAKKKREPSAWILHIKKTQADNPGMSYKTAMKLASKTYVKKKKPTKTASSAKESAAAGDTADGGSQ